MHHIIININKKIHIAREGRMIAFVYRHCPVWVLIILLAILPLKASLAQQAGKSIDEVRVLIDISGSMKRTDPNNLRSPALGLFVSLLPTGSHAGVWTFGQWVNMLIKPGPVDGEWKISARSAAEKINSHGMFTNIEAAIHDSTWDWARPAPGHRRSLILLTDGLVDISEDSGEDANSRNRIIENLLPRLRSAGVKMNTIALSQESDTDLLRQLAAATGGWFETVESADRLEKLFLRMFEKVANTSTLPLTDNRVTIDKSIKEVTFLIFRESEDKDSSITTPNGDIITPQNHPKEIQWHKESRYDLVTINTPEPGEWLIDAKLDPDNRVMVVTDLQLKSTILPNDLTANKPVTFRVTLEQEGKIIQRREFLQFVKVALTQTSMKDKKWQWELSDDGKAPDTAANDGIYSGHLEESLTDGEYEFEVNVDGTTFQRNTRQLVKVYDHPVSAEITSPDDGRITISMVPYLSLINADTMHVEAEHIRPSGEKKDIQIPRVSTSEWRLELDEHENPGKHSMSLHVTGNSPEGEKIDIRIAATLFEIGTQVEPQNNLEKASSAIPASNETNSDHAAQNVNWLFVGLRILVLNIFLAALIFAGYKLWPRIRKKLIPNPTESFANAK
jgi:uncharacterized protein (TIGR03503 family)